MEGRIQRILKLSILTGVYWLNDKLSNKIMTYSYIKFGQSIWVI